MSTGPCENNSLRPAEVAPLPSSAYGNAERTVSPQVEASVFVSIVSHGHGNMVASLVDALLACPEIGRIMVTHNIAETLPLPVDERIGAVHNQVPAGFAANHNAAFGQCHLPYFCVVNPDIQIRFNPFPVLLATLRGAGAAVAAPLVKDSAGNVADSIRYFPGLWSLLRKALGGAGGRYHLETGRSMYYPEWVAGMFMLFRSTDFKRLGGFDARFFLYYEDVDICVRAWRAGMKVLACPGATVIHDARRDSHRKLRYLGWHVASMVRYFGKHWGRLPTPPDCG